MRKTFLAFALLVSGSAFAQVFPQVYTYSSHVQVQVWNHTTRDVNCSGMVTMRMEDGSHDPQYFFDRVWSRGHAYRSVYPRDMSKRIVSAYHSISCF